MCYFETYNATDSYYHRVALRPTLIQRLRAILAHVVGV